MKPKIYDCFSFFNENDVLEIRLNTLYDYVDKFVIVEATKTHSGLDKPLYYDKERFKRFEDKIIYVVLDEFPEFRTSWTYENYQRNHIFNVLEKEKCSDNDIIIISDLDEIISASAIAQYAMNGEGITSLEQDMYYCFLNMKKLSDFVWDYAKIMHFSDFYNEENNNSNYTDFVLEELNQGITPTKIRAIKTKRIIKNGGWHFSYLGNVEKIIEKLKSFSHQEFNKEEIVNKEFLLKQIENENDILGRNIKYRFVPIDSSFPEYIRKNRKNLSHYIHKVSLKNWLKYYGIFNYSEIKYKNVKRGCLEIFKIKINFKLKENK